ncbi:MAG: hypothetical protein R3323_05795 [Wenzhouxiangellaceae bacterium]|nr:hypothetical protein [Wenzhouxiangellaceae bacterium]
MPYARTAVFWFIALLAILLMGFWRTYFSVIFGEMHPTHHLHSAAMLGWVLLLIHQAWRIRGRNLPAHRKVGQLSWIIAPLVVITGSWVTLHNIANFSDPASAPAMSIFWLGWASVIVFGILFAMAMKHRKNPQYHGRYMIATALVFLIPGLGRAVSQYLPTIGLQAPSFYQMLFVPLLISLLLIAYEWRTDRVRSPFIVFSVLWGLTLLLWVLLPKFGPWETFTVWAASLGA